MLSTHRKNPCFGRYQTGARYPTSSPLSFISVSWSSSLSTTLVGRRNKTSGKTGLHVYVPLGAKYDYDQARRFAEVVANIVHRQLPRTSSIVRKPALRQRRVYLDFLQNSRGQTLASAYSVRPAAGAPVSAPLKWAEVRRSLKPGRFTNKTMPSRIDKFGDLWTPVLKSGIDISQTLRRLLR